MRDLKNEEYMMVFWLLIGALSGLYVTANNYLGAIIGAVLGYAVSQTTGVSWGKGLSSYQMESEKVDLGLMIVTMFFATVTESFIFLVYIMMLVIRMMMRRTDQYQVMEYSIKQKDYSKIIFPMIGAYVLLQILDVAAGTGPASLLSAKIFKGATMLSIALPQSTTIGLTMAIAALIIMNNALIETSFFTGIMPHMILKTARKNSYFSNDGMRRAVADAMAALSQSVWHLAVYMSAATAVYADMNFTYAFIFFMLSIAGARWFGAREGHKEGTVDEIGGIHIGTNMILMGLY